jgi:FAD/FMN-containing dehydrogenase
VCSSDLKRVKAAFDPRSVLNFGRMHDGI